MSKSVRHTPCLATWVTTATMGGKPDEPPTFHTCVSPETHPMEHRCICGALYPS